MHGGASESSPPALRSAKVKMLRDKAISGGSGGRARKKTHYDSIRLVYFH